MVRIVTLLATLAVWGLSAGADAPRESAALQKMFDDYFERSLERTPLLGTFIGDHRYDDRLPNSISPTYQAESLKLDQQFLEAALPFEKQTLSDEDRLSLEVFISQLRTSIEGAKYPGELLPINQMFSLPTFMPVLGSGSSAQPFATASDYDRFLARMREFAVWSDQAIVNMREGMGRGIVHPRVVMEKVLSQVAQIIAEKPEASLFYQPIQKFPASVGAADRARLATAYRRAILEEINPAYRRLHDFIRDEYLKSTRSTVAWTALPDGQAWYAFLVRVSTTTDLAPATIHQLGLDEVQRIRGEMEQVKTQVGFKGDLPAFFKFLQDDPRFYYTDAESLIAGYITLKKKIDSLLPKLFVDFPRADYEVRPVEAFRAQSAAGASYVGPSADGSRPGYFYVNTYNLKAQPKFGMETLSLHEASPGHHFQIAIQRELKGVPRFRRFGDGYVAYDEGWALYAESIGKELGMFTDPYQNYGRLSDEMLRAMRLVVDTGLHTRNWTREQAIKYMLDNSSMAASDVEAEVERYIANPGQALGYKIGQIRIREMRTKAERALGARFDVKEFHSQVLRDGALPLPVLEAKIDRWIVKKKS